MTDVKKVVCPKCGKEIDKAEIRIFQPYVKQVLDMGILPASYGNFAYKDGKYYLVFDSQIDCPNCRKNFSHTIWIPTADESTQQNKGDLK